MSAPSCSSSITTAANSPTRQPHDVLWDDEATLYGGSKAGSQAGSKRNSHSDGTDIKAIDAKALDANLVPVLLEKQWTKFEAQSETAVEDVFPDGGLQAWSVLVGGFLTTFCGFGMIAGYGAFNTYYHNNLLSQHPLSVTAWIGSVSSCITFAGATIGGTVMDRLGPRKVMMTGTSIMTIGFLALSWCTELWHFFLCQSLFISSGIALMFVCPMTSANDWFKERRSMASGVVMSGASAGSIVWPLIIANVPRQVGWSWTVRIIALCQLFLLSLATILLRLRPRATVLEQPSTKKHLFYWRAFATHPVYLLTSFSSFCFSFGYFFFLYFCGTFAIQKGWVKEGPYVLIACNAASAIGRVGAGFLADRVGRYNVLFLTTFGSSVVLFSWFGVNSLAGLFIVAVVYGVATGGNVALQSVCVVQAVKDLEHLGVTGTLIGQQFGFQALAVLIGPPISGYILGTSGSAAQQMARFPYAIALNGSVIMIGACCALIARYMQSKKLVAKI
ncbi:U4/U6-U5 snRNP complex subunit dib1 [Naganishia albida]|nr:U4/U6-U5 snRNP complex subunit dib1 [Naganishia albida]